MPKQSDAITAEKVRDLLNYDPQSGDLTWRNPPPNRVVGAPAGFVDKNGCRLVTITDVPMRAHRLVWLYVHGEYPDGYVAAHNGNLADLRLDNLYVKASREKDEQHQERLSSRRVAYRLNHLWKRTNAKYGRTDWPSIKEFAVDIGVVPNHHQLVPIDASRPIGPDNFIMERRAKIDRGTVEGRAAYLREKRKNSLDRYRHHHLNSTFGISLEQYKEMYKAQNGLCAICKQPETAMRKGEIINLAVDHCHTTGAVRGLLCRDCNHTLGKMKEDSAALRRAADYLDHHAAKQNSVPASNVVHLKQKER